jgi:hypothetical protein
MLTSTDSHLVGWESYLISYPEVYGAPTMAGESYLSPTSAG